MSRALTRWFIVVDRAKKPESLARPGAEISTGTHSHLGGNDSHLAKDVVDGASGQAVKTDVEHGVAVSEQVHYALEDKLCVYGLDRNASKMDGWVRWRLMSS
jgi:hypothetical protein